MDYGFSERRNKRREKRKENRKHPYRKGGGHRIIGENKKIILLIRSILDIILIRGLLY